MWLDNGMDRRHIVDRLSAVRMQPFLDECDGNYKDALALYGWHTELSSAVKDVLALTEIFLRNAIDEELLAWNARNNGPQSWLLEPPCRPLRSIVSGHRRKAIGRAQAAVDRRPSSHPRHGCAITHDDVLSHTTFGLWRAVLPNHHPDANHDEHINAGRQILWDEAIQSAFPNVPDPDGSITYWNVWHCNDLRNKVAHMDSLLNVDVIAESRRAFELIDSIDHQLATWVTSRSQVSKVFNKRPGR